jgi:hypothetical protein
MLMPDYNHLLVTCTVTWSDVTVQSITVLYCHLPYSYAYSNRTLPYFTVLLAQTVTELLCVLLLFSVLIAHTVTELFRTLLSFIVLVRIQQQNSSVLYYPLLYS